LPCARAEVGCGLEEAEEEVVVLAKAADEIGGSARMAATVPRLAAAWDAVIVAVRAFYRFVESIKRSNPTKSAFSNQVCAPGSKMLHEDGVASAAPLEASRFITI
jgi:hypothetical protein